VSREPNKASYRDGETVTVTATAKSGYSFVSWTGALNETTPSVTFTINSDLRLTANFERQGVTPPDTTRPPEVNGGVVGDWLVLDSDNRWKTVFSFKSTGQFAITDFVHIGDFWIQEVPIESGDEGCQITWYILGDKILFGESCDGEEYFEGYIYTVSGDTLILEHIEGEGGWASFIRVNLETFKQSLGQVYSLDPALDHTDWFRFRTSEYQGEHIGFSYARFGDGDNVYLSESYDDRYWYTEGSRLVLLGTECAQYNSDEHYCVAYSVAQTVTIDYQLSNGTLRLRPIGSNGDWDEWTRELYKSKASLEKSKRAVSPFQALRR
jgi:uncharacterized repeat protein (TIGR02543 family)